MEKTTEYLLDSLSKKQLEVVEALSKCENAEPCLKKLMSIIDGQASCEEIKEFEDHIQECNGCFQEYEVNQTVREIITNSIKKRCAPADLKKSITEKISSL